MKKKRRFQKGHSKTNKYAKFSRVGKDIPKPIQASREEIIEAERTYRNAMRLLNKKFIKKIKK